MALAVTSPESKARAVTIGLDAAAVSLLRECFNEFQIQTTSLTGDAVSQIQHEKFDACILRLDKDAPPVLEAARNSEPNRRMVVYGICDTPEQAMSYSRYGINAIFPESYLPDAHAASASGDRQGVMRVVEATHLLVVNELRRYIRVPIVTAVLAQAGNMRFSAYSQEVSAGGISLSGAPILPPDSPMEISFLLLDLPRITVRSKVSWIKPPDQLGLRFDMEDDRRLPVRDWIDRYLDAS